MIKQKNDYRSEFINLDLSQPDLVDSHQFPGDAPRVTGAAIAKSMLFVGALMEKILKKREKVRSSRDMETLVERDMHIRPHISIFVFL